MSRQVINKQPRIPTAPNSIQRGTALKELLGQQAVDCLARNIWLVYPPFDRRGFRQAAREEDGTQGIMQRGRHIALSLRNFLPARFDQAVKILLDSLTPPLEQTQGNGLAVFFYLPHTCFIAEFGLDPEHNGGQDPFESSMRGMYELTRRFTAEFSIRPFLMHHQQRTLDRLAEWQRDRDPHVRRLCSEGTRPRLPWASRIPAFISDPSPTLPILEALKDDPSLYVRRSVANHLGDVAKDHLERVLTICDRWLTHATGEVKWVIRHALRHPAKMGNPHAIRIRTAAK